MNKSMSEILSRKSKAFFLRRGYVESATLSIIPMESDEEIDALEFRDRLKKLLRTLRTLETIRYHLHNEDEDDNDDNTLGQVLFVLSNLDAEECPYEVDEAAAELGLSFGFAPFARLTDFMHIQNYDAFLGSDEDCRWWEVYHDDFNFDVRDVINGL